LIPREELSSSSELSSLDPSILYFQRTNGRQKKKEKKRKFVSYEFFFFSGKRRKVTGVIWSVTSFEEVVKSKVALSRTL
jgi:hypothetical protein